MSAQAHTLLRREGALWDNPSAPLVLEPLEIKRWERVCSTCHLVAHEQNVRPAGCVDCVEFRGLA